MAVHSPEVAAALALLKANGFRVTQPKPKKTTRVGPTFVAQFADGEVTRMTTFCLAKLDYKRGEAVARAAWQSRMKAWGHPVPAIVASHFERDGVRLDNIAEAA